MKKMIAIIFILFLCGCSAVPSPVSKKRAKKLMENLTYIRDTKTGICYAVASSRIWILGIFPSQQKGLGLTQVPCKECKQVLIKD